MIPIPVPMPIPEPLGRIGVSNSPPGERQGAGVAVPRASRWEAALADGGLGKGSEEAAGLTAAGPCVRPVPLSVAFIPSGIIQRVRIDPAALIT